MTDLFLALNGYPPRIPVGVRDPDYPCAEFDGKGYNGRGDCMSDGHYMCTECSELSPDAYRFTEHGRDGRADRLRLYWASQARLTAGSLAR